MNYEEKRGEIVYVNILRYVELGKRLLQNFEIVYEFVVKFCSPIDLVNGNLIWMQDIKKLAVDCACSELFDLC